MQVPFIAAGLLLLAGCQAREPIQPGVLVPFSEAGASSPSTGADDSGARWIDFDVDVPATGRYETIIRYRGELDPTSVLWVEDYLGNTDGRVYDITGPLGPMESAMEDASTGLAHVAAEGSPLQAGPHPMRLHLDGAPGAEAHSVEFRLLRHHRDTPETVVANLEGEGPWRLVWSDEFDDEGVPDPAKWTHDIGDWGWGNREPQYYTDSGDGNAFVTGGQLVIEAKPPSEGRPMNAKGWTSARLTTRGKVSFLYGRIEFRAKVPATDGTWSAGWLLGDAYRDEISWPYCGEIDVMEAVGREIDDTSGDGLNHGSCHTRAYYFKAGNHISEVIPVTDMANEFHVYAAEWTPDEVRLYVDGTHYYTYAQHESKEAWPFDEPQNLILNLAMGGGMGGTIDEGPGSGGIGPQRLIVDYVRVLERGSGADSDEPETATDANR